MSIRETGSLRIEPDEWQQRIIIDGRVVAQASLQSTFLHFNFSSHATVADAQEILRSIVYENTAPGMPALPNKLKIQLTDLLQNVTQVEVGIDYANEAPKEIRLSNSDIYLNPEGGWGAYVSADDPNYGEKLTYELINAANGQFKLEQHQYGATLSLAKPLAAQSSFTITIRVTDQRGLHFDQTFVLSVYKDPDGGLDEYLDEVIEGTDSHDWLSGLEGASLIKAFDGNDLLVGNGGSDTLHGGLGRDTLVGGTGSDEFVFDTRIASKRNTNIDRIKDFNPKEDALILDTSVFTKLVHTGQLSKQAFWNGSKAHDASDRIIYHKTTGNLFYDPDGSGKKAAIKFAILPSKLKLAHHDFLLI